MDYDSSDENHQELMEYLVSEGAAIIDGIDDNGEAIYRFDMEILEEVMPELHQVLVQDMDNILIDLYQKDLIEVSYDENLNAHMTVSEEGKRILEENGFDMSDSEDYDF
jgi:Tfp pilus assembly ATPase PilU